MNNTFSALTTPGVAYIIPRRKVGRRKNFGTHKMISGQLMICLGYTLDGLNEIYIPAKALSALKSAVRVSEKKVGYRILRYFLAKYEAD